MVRWSLSCVKTRATATKSTSNLTRCTPDNDCLMCRGYNIGIRLIEDFLAKANTGRCRDIRETADVISKVAFKIYLNITPTVTSWAADEKSFSLIFDENPLADFVELPEDGPYEKIWYSNVLCGVIRGALEMVFSMICIC